MKTRTVRSLINFSLCAAVLIAFAIPCAAVERPFKLQGTTVVLGNPFDPAGAQMQGKGTATHLGNWTNSGVVFFDASSGPPFPALVVIHFSAANGDQLDTILVGYTDLSAVSTGTYYITGGGGRFTGASGKGVFTAQNNPDGTLSYNAEGTINY
jgi:hypothetical protein